MNNLNALDAEKPGIVERSIKRWRGGSIGVIARRVESITEKECKQTDQASVPLVSYVTSILGVHTRSKTSGTK